MTSRLPIHGKSGMNFIFFQSICMERDVFNGVTQKTLTLTIITEARQAEKGPHMWVCQKFMPSFHCSHCKNKKIAVWAIVPPLTRLIATEWLHLSLVPISPASHWSTKQPAERDCNSIKEMEKCKKSIECLCLWICVEEQRQRFDF